MFCSLDESTDVLIDMLQPYKGVLVDYGGVLSLPQEQEALSQMAKTLGIDLPLMVTVLNTGREAYDRGDFRAPAYWTTLADQFSLQLNAAKVETLVELEIRSWNRANHNVVRAIAATKDAGKHTAIASNMSWELREGLPGIRTWIPGLEGIFSCEIGSTKPDASFFQECIRRLALDTEEIVFIDDKLENTLGARKLGLSAIFLSLDSGDSQVKIEPLP